jgi:glucokinase
MNMAGQAGLILGVDVGATTIAGGLVDPVGTVVTTRAVPTGRLGRGEAVLRNLLDVVGTLQEEARRLRRAILGIGIGVPGVVDVESGAIGEDIYKIPEFRALPLSRLLEERADLPVALDNDVNALTLGEWMFGQGRGLRHMAMIAVGTSIGGGLVLNGALVRGAHGYGGEIGHIPIELDGPDCFCGSRGCLKLYAAGPDIGRRARDLATQSPKSLLLSMANGDPERVDAPLVFAAAAAGDPVGVSVVARAAQALGAGVATLINLCNPELIALGGGVMEAGDLLLEPVQRWARFYAFEAAAERTRIVRSLLTKESGVVGAAALFLYERGSRHLL